MRVLREAVLARGDRPLLYDKLAISYTYLHAKNCNDPRPITLSKMAYLESESSAVAILGGGWLQSPSSDGPPWCGLCRYRCGLKSWKIVNDILSIVFTCRQWSLVCEVVNGTHARQEAMMCRHQPWTSFWQASLTVWQQYRNFPDLIARSRFLSHGPSVPSCLMCEDSISRTYVATTTNTQKKIILEIQWW